jgi:hypothetical protein
MIRCAFAHPDQMIRPVWEVRGPFEQVRIRHRQAIKAIEYVEKAVQSQ